MKRILFLSAIAFLSFFSFLGCDDENKILSEDNKPTTEEFTIVLNSDSLLLYVGDVDTLIATIKNGDKIVDYKVSWSTDGAQVAVVDSNGVVTALSVGSAVITVTYQNVCATCKVTVTERPRTYENGFEYVDLGLSVNWATCNVGTANPWERGDYYAWGEIEPKDVYSDSTYKWCVGSIKILTKYNNQSRYGPVVDNKTDLDPEDDVAHVKWGGSWRMPTVAELVELRDNCTWTWYSSDNTEFNGVAGYKVTSRIEGYTDRFIFLPAAGCRDRTRLNGVGDSGLYWSSSLSADNPRDAYVLDFSSNYVFTYNYNRNLGFSMRPVCP